MSKEHMYIKGVYIMVGHPEFEKEINDYIDNFEEEHAVEMQVTVSHHYMRGLYRAYIMLEPANGGEPKIYVIDDNHSESIPPRVTKYTPEKSGE